MSAVTTYICEGCKRPIDDNDQRTWASAISFNLAGERGRSYLGVFLVDDERIDFHGPECLAQWVARHYTSGGER